MSLVVLLKEGQKKIILYAGRDGMTSWRNRAPTRRYADCVKDDTRSSHLQPTPFVTSKLHSMHTKSDATVMDASKFSCAVVVSVITSGTCIRETIGRTESNDINTLRPRPDCRSGRSNHTNHCSSKRREIIERNQPGSLRELQTPWNFLDLIQARCSEQNWSWLHVLVYTYSVIHKRDYLKSYTNTNWIMNKNDIFMTIRER